MCGIAGIIQFDREEIETRLLKDLSNVLSDRGPNDLGFLGWSRSSPIRVTKNPNLLQNCWLGLVHRRLSILDLSEAGWQPMVTPDGRYAIIFNGEIYNYLELQAELKALGYTFNSHSDTEVLLTAYSHWGSQTLKRLVGMFAFAILDTYSRKLFLARDFFGIKPLYYTYWQEGFAFASEIKALLKLPAVSQRVNPQRLYDYLRFGLTDNATETLWADIHQLPPAHYVEISLDEPRQLQPVRYWQITLNQPLEISFQEAAEQLRERFLENVRLHLRSDVQVGAALSGGIDSSSIVMAMRYLQPNLEIHTFSYTADDPRVNEERWIDIVGKAANTIVHKTRPTPQELVEDLDPLVYIQDQPFGGTSIYAQHRVFRLANQSGIKVMLDGQGADELLGGYEGWSLAARLSSLLRQGKWLKASQFLQSALKLPGVGLGRLSLSTGGLALPDRLNRLARLLLRKDRIPPWLNAAWFAEDRVELKPSRQSQSQEVLREQLYQSVEIGLPSLLRYEDRNSMTYSLESRVPFLTPALANFIFSLPEEYIIAADGTTKAVFREAMRGIVPDPILDRKDKIGFATPEYKWLETLRPWVERVLSCETAKQLPMLNLEEADKEWQAVLSGRKQFDFRIWRWLNLIRWVEQYGVEFH